MQTQLLRPKSIVRYSREAFIYGPGNVRVTLDTALLLMLVYFLVFVYLRKLFQIVNIYLLIIVCLFLKDICSI